MRRNPKEPDKPIKPARHQAHDYSKQNGSGSRVITAKHLASAGVWLRRDMRLRRKFPKLKPASNAAERLTDSLSADLLAPFNTMNHSKKPQYLLNCAYIAYMVVCDFEDPSRRVTQSKAHIYLPKLSGQYFSNLEKEKQEKFPDEQRQVMKLGNYNFEYLQMILAERNVPPFTRLTMSVAMKPFANAGHDINAIVLPYVNDGPGAKANVILFDAHGLIRKPWCYERNFDAYYSISDLEIYHSLRGDAAVEEWITSLPSFRQWFLAQGELASLSPEQLARAHIRVRQPAAVVGPVIKSGIKQARAELPAQEITDEQASTVLADLPVLEVDDQQARPSVTDSQVQEAEDEQAPPSLTEPSPSVVRQHLRAARATTKPQEAKPNPKPKVPLHLRERQAAEATKSRATEPQQVTFHGKHPPRSGPKKPSRKA